MIKGLLLGAASIAQLSISVLSTAQAQDAQSEFKKTADEVCLTVEQSGGRKEAELSAGAEAKVNNFLRYLAGLNVSASGKSKTESYQGVSQQELAAVLRDARNCRLEVFKLMNKSALSAPPMPTPRQTVPLIPAPNAQPEAASQKAPNSAVSNVPPEPSPQQNALSKLRAPFRQEPAANPELPPLRAPFHLDK